MSNAVLMRDGTSVIEIFLVTLSRRNVRPLIRSPGLLGFSRVDREDLVVTDIFEVEGSPGACTAPRGIVPGRCW